MTKKDFEITRIIVWLDDEKEWNRVYLHKDSGKLYVRIGAGASDFAKLDDCNIREISNL